MGGGHSSVHTCVSRNVSTRVYVVSGKCECMCLCQGMFASRSEMCRSVCVCLYVCVTATCVQVDMCLRKMWGWYVCECDRAITSQ